MPTINTVIKNNNNNNYYCYYYLYSSKIYMIRDDLNTEAVFVNIVERGFVYAYTFGDDTCCIQRIFKTGEQDRLVTGFRKWRRSWKTKNIIGDLQKHSFTQIAICIDFLIIYISSKHSPIRNAQFNIQFQVN